MNSKSSLINTSHSENLSNTLPGDSPIFQQSVTADLSTRDNIFDSQGSQDSASVLTCPSIQPTTFSTDHAYSQLLAASSPYTVAEEANPSLDSAGNILLKKGNSHDTLHEEPHLQGVQMSDLKNKRHPPRTSMSVAGQETNKQPLSQLNNVQGLSIPQNSSMQKNDPKETQSIDAQPTSDFQADNIQQGMLYPDTRSRELTTACEETNKNTCQHISQVMLQSIQADILKANPVNSNVMASSLYTQADTTEPNSDTDCITLPAEQSQTDADIDVQNSIQSTIDSTQAVAYMKINTTKSIRQSILMETSPTSNKASESTDCPTHSGCHNHTRISSALINKEVASSKYIPRRKPRSQPPNSKKAPPLPPTPPEVHPPIAKNPIFNISPSILLKNLLQVHELPTKSSYTRIRHTAKISSRPTVRLDKTCKFDVSNSNDATMSNCDDQFSNMGLVEGPYYIHPWVTHPTQGSNIHHQNQKPHERDEPLSMVDIDSNLIAQYRDESAAVQSTGRRRLVEMPTNGSVMSLTEFQHALKNEDFRDLAHGIVPITRYTPCLTKDIDDLDHDKPCELKNLKSPSRKETIQSNDKLGITSNLKHNEKIKCTNKKDSRNCSDQNKPRARLITSNSTKIKLHTFNCNEMLEQIASQPICNGTLCPRTSSRTGGHKSPQQEKTEPTPRPLIKNVSELAKKHPSEKVKIDAVKVKDKAVDIEKWTQNAQVHLAEQDPVSESSSIVKLDNPPTDSTDQNHSQLVARPLHFERSPSHPMGSANSSTAIQLLKQDSVNSIVSAYTVTRLIAPLPVRLPSLPIYLKSSMLTPASLLKPKTREERLHWLFSKEYPMIQVYSKEIIKSESIPNHSNSPKELPYIVIQSKHSSMSKQIFMADHRLKMPGISSKGHQTALDDRKECIARAQKQAMKLRNALKTSRYE
ncbi:hypothetical protein BDV3_001137 [Batrachochytrium dendrobatidis]